ncbi:MAG: hypothetical protein CM15mP102_20340 [Flavobacteriales bacterium]|nr:MAG: hypothetical protein CM15mP102_20340 [Flavobacteriales bacterium]
MSFKFPLPKGQNDHLNQYILSLSNDILQIDLFFLYQVKQSIIAHYFKINGIYFFNDFFNISSKSLYPSWLSLTLDGKYGGGSGRF